MYSTVAFSLVFNLADPNYTDFTRIVYVRATTGLVVDVFDSHSTNITHTSWRLHGHRSY